MKLLCRLEGQPRTIADREVEGRSMKQIADDYAASRRLQGDLSTLRVEVCNGAEWFVIPVSACVRQIVGEPVRIARSK